MNSLLPDPTASLLDRIKISMVGLKMPRAIEVVDICVSRLDRGEIWTCPGKVESSPDVKGELDDEAATVHEGV